MPEHRVLDHELFTRAEEIPSEANGRRRTTRLAQPGNDFSDDAPHHIPDPSSNDAEHSLRFRSDLPAPSRLVPVEFLNDPAAEEVSSDVGDEP